MAILARQQRFSRIIHLAWLVAGASTFSAQLAAAAAGEPAMPPPAPPLRLAPLPLPAAPPADPYAVPAGGSVSSPEPAVATNQSLFPSTPVTEPPALPERPPLPTPPDLTLPARRTPVTPKAPLAWRARAYALAEQPSAKGSSAPLSRAFDRPAADVYPAIMSACAAAGILIESLNSAAGEILASDPAGTGKVVITVRETAPSRTTVTATTVGSGRAVLQTALESLFASVNLTLSGNRAM